MKKRLRVFWEYQREFNVRLSAVLAIVVILQFIAMISVPQNPFDFVWYVVSILLLCAGYMGGRTFGLIASLIAIFLDGSTDIFTHFILHHPANAPVFEALWYVLFPLSGLCGGFIGDYVRTVCRRMERLSRADDDLLMIDSVTGLVTRKKFLLDVTEEIERARRHFARRSATKAAGDEWADTSDALEPHEAFAVLLFSIRYLSDLKKLYGQSRVDSLMASLAARLESVARLTDKKARLDEALFGVILLDTTPQTAEIAVQRFREAIEKPTQVTDEGRVRDISLRAQMGLACCPQDGQSPESLIAKAEQELANDLG